MLRWMCRDHGLMHRYERGGGELGMMVGITLSVIGACIVCGVVTKHRPVAKVHWSFDAPGHMYVDW
jgi:hypothetical protein